MLEKILVADDDIKVRERFYEILSSLGYKVTCAPSGSEALLRLTEEKYRLIVLDEDMPSLSGPETARKIREFDKDTPIVILSDKEELSSLLSVQVIKKDFSTHLMLRRILELLKEEGIVRRESSPAGLEAKILIVDDNPQIREVLYSFLDKRGYKPILASSGEEALMKVKIEKPQLVFLDIRMPGMDGLLVLKKIKEIKPSTKVVMLTSAQEAYMVEQAKSLGAEDYLTKPCDFKELEAVLLSLLVSEK
ncbi:MAG: hypothetical protein DRP61_04645 [Candidatus Omnitrophota bacterium]|nr:MAG: hypothetical protein DRP61_04645 [Candidatus Omnitrophota bacterium]